MFMLSYKNCLKRQEIAKHKSHRAIHSIIDEIDDERTRKALYILLDKIYYYDDHFDKDIYNCENSDTHSNDYDAQQDSDVQYVIHQDDKEQSEINKSSSSDSNDEPDIIENPIEDPIEKPVII